jgi:hypothetical protein
MKAASILVIGGFFVLRHLYTTIANRHMKFESSRRNFGIGVDDGEFLSIFVIISPRSK